MPKISVRIDPELKKKMEESPHLNWSEIIRRAIKEQINHESEKSLAQAVLLNEKVRKKAPETTTDTVEIIRKFRDVRR